MPVNTFSAVCFGEILWDILPSGPVPGGAPMNVAYHLHRLGIPTSLITRVGNDESGAALRELLTRNGINSSFLQTDPAVPTGKVYAIPDDKADMQYDIVSPAAWDHIEIVPEAAARVGEAGYFVFGTLAARNQDSRKSLFQLLRIARTKVLDINLRAPFYDQALIETLLLESDMVKVNAEELDLICSWWGHYRSFREKLDLLRNKFRISTAIVTRGADGAAVFQGEEILEHPGFRVQVADTVGSGDAFLAGFIRSLAQGLSPEDALAFATALGALVASKVGGWPEYEESEIFRLINK